MKDHALDGHLRLEHLKQVPGDGLAFAVLVRRKIQLGRVLHQRPELRHLGPFGSGHDIQRGEIVVDVDAELGPRQATVTLRDLGGASRQVTDVADRRLDDVAVAEVLGDLLGLGR